jgi:hypothetical protein
MNKLEQFIEKHLDKPWSWGVLSYNPSITPEFIEKHFNKPWSWAGISYNPSITPEFIEKHIDKTWIWGYDGLSRNPSITPEFIEKHINKPWDWSGLSSNTFGITDKIKAIKKLKKFLMKAYWILRERIEKKRMHPDSDYFKEIMNNIFKN